MSKVRVFFQGFGYTPLYLSGIKKNMKDWEGIDVAERVRETKASADQKSPSNTVRKRGSK